MSNLITWSFVACLVSAGVACGTDIAKPVPQPAAPAAQQPVAPAAPLPTSKVTKLEFSENDFVENDKSRDPFRSFTIGVTSATTTRGGPQTRVILPEYSIDELKLAAIVMSGDYPRAMVIDPAGKGWVLRRGEYVGRAEMVHVGGSTGSDYQLHWRVDRVRAQDVVLLRDDPAQPGIPPATKVIPLHPEGDDREDKLGRN